jgi:hypothetical protein
MKHALRLSLILALAACGDSSPDGEGMPSDTPPSEAAPAPAVDTPIGTVTILDPTEGAEVAGGTVTVQLEVAGFPIVIAGDMTPGTGHHHLYLDADLTPATEPVPSIPGSIVHMGDASSTFTFEGVAPGEHRLIAVVADGAHFPLQPWVVDTVTFRVAEPR